MNVDGGASSNNFLMQFQSNIIDIPIIRPDNIETTALGAAMLAGLKVDIWDNEDDLMSLQNINKTFKPNINKDEQNNLINGWQKAVIKTKEN